jgi:hypothetical protein
MERINLHQKAKQKDIRTENQYDSFNFMNFPLPNDLKNCDKVISLWIE